MMASPISEANIKVYIKEAESLLLKPGEHFDEQSRKFICNLNSKDVVACPGSGKTTALVAKLYILTKFMPFEDGSGICVLTHTNVAIDLIKEKLGKQGSILFEHPNFCGTIQSFVNSYLAQPMYVKKYGHRINTIDDDIAYSYISSKLRRWNKTRHNLHFLESVKNLRFDYKESKWIKKNGAEFSFPDKFSDDNSKYVRKEVKNKKINALKKGILFYDEAYSFGKAYLDCYPVLSHAFSERFKYVFVDEAQDTSALQYGILTDLFNNTTVQMVGDPNQAIYGDSEAVDDEAKSWAKIVYSKPHLTIENSKRLSIESATAIRDIAESPCEDLSGFCKRGTKPKLIFYEHDRILDVLPTFAKLIAKYDLNDNSKYTHKAIGRIVKKHEKRIRVPSCYPAFYRTSAKRVFFNGLRQYLVKPMHVNDTNQVKQVSDLLINALIRMLALAGIYDKSSKRKPYTKTSLLEYLRSQDQEDKLLTRLSSWSYKMLSHPCPLDCSDKMLQYPTCVLNDIIKYVENVFFPLFDAEFEKIHPFITHEVEEIQSEAPLDNVFKKTIDGQDVRIEIDSVHGVKGETHTSTLFLDTYYYAYDSTRLVNFFTSGGKGADRRNEAKCKALRVAYVAMSRPTHLLCVAFPLPEAEPILHYWQDKPEEERLWEIIQL